MDESINIFKEIKQRFLIPFNNPKSAYFGYLFVMVIGVGGLGIWLSLYQYISIKDQTIHSVTVNISTFFMALLASSFIDLSIHPNIINKVSLTIYSIMVLGLGVILFLLSNSIKSGFVIIPAVIGWLLSILIWHISNADNEKLDDDTYNKKIYDEAKKKHGKNWNQV